MAWSLESRVPPWMEGKGKGWVTAEYNMLPGSTSPRKQRERGGRVDGRTTEIQRLVGRSLRATIDLEALGENMITVDCDVLQADGGTRTASITGGFIALADALIKIKKEGAISKVPISDYVAAISVGVQNGNEFLDLDYIEDSSADIDMNIVMVGAGEFVEVQGTAEGVARLPGRTGSGGLAGPLSRKNANSGNGGRSAPRATAGRF